MLSDSNPAMKNISTLSEMSDFGENFCLQVKKIYRTLKDNNNTVAPMIEYRVRFVQA